MEKIFTIENIVIYFLTINIISFFAMYVDKRKAKKGSWRIKEKTLFILVALGGWIGGIAGVYVLRHKTKKSRFTIGFPAIIIIEIICIIIYFTVIK